MRHELEEKGYEERARGQRFCWTKNLKSSPAVAERCVHLNSSVPRNVVLLRRLATTDFLREAQDLF